MLQRSIKLISLLSIGLLSLSSTAVADTLNSQPGNYIDLGPRVNSATQLNLDTPLNSTNSTNTTTLDSPLQIPTELDSVFQQPLRLEIRLSRRQVTLYRGSAVIKRYPIAVGRPGWETPVGTYAVRQKIKNPTWVHPLEKGVVIPGGDPENPLGRYWIGFWTDGRNWIGFHGTPNPKSVGRPASHGCIRMYNKDVEELFRQVSLGTVVTVVR